MLSTVDKFGGFIVGFGILHGLENKEEMPIKNVGPMLRRKEVGRCGGPYK